MDKELQQVISDVIRDKYSWLSYDMNSNIFVMANCIVKELMEKYNISPKKVEVDQEYADSYFEAAE